MAVMDDAPRVHAETRAQWRTWLTEHHATVQSAWLVSWKKATGKPAISYDGAVSEALAVGWVDSRPRKLDDERTMLYFSPRKPASAWSRPNKIRVEALREAGLMLPAGERAVEAAVANGSWTVLDEVEDLIVPDDLAAAFSEYVDAENNWNRFPPSARRAFWSGSPQPSGRRPAPLECTRLRGSHRSASAQLVGNPSAIDSDGARHR